MDLNIPGEEMSIDMDSNNKNGLPSRTHLHFNDFYPWKQFNSCYARGTAFLEESQLSSIEIADRFSNLKTPEECIALSNQINGFYSIIFQNDKILYAAVDRVRSIPLFYCLKDEEFYISDNPHWIKREIRSNEVDEIAAAEFMLTGYVTGRDTLYPDIKQLQAGEALLLEHRTGILKLKRIRYYKYIPGNYTTISEEDNLKELDRVLVRVFKRLIKLASGRTIVVPLSGGYDSRLIVLMLKRLGYDNVIAFSYGKPKNKESEVSRKVAQSLGIRWEFAPYSNDDWYKWYRSEEFKKYSHMACGLSSVPLIQDWPAVWMLKKNCIIPEDSIFVPGHSADLLTGSRSFNINLKKNYYTTKLDLTGVIQSIFLYHYSLWNISDKSDLIFQFKDRISSCISDEEEFPDNSSTFEFWDVSERQSKFIINSLRAYEFWGYSWWIPFWDNEFMEFWSRIPIDMKLHQKIYKLYVNNIFHTLSDKNIEISNEKSNPITNIVIAFIKRTPFIGVARKIYRHHNISKAYESNPLAFYGAIPKEKFSRLYSGNSNINSFLAADIISSLSRESRNAKDFFALLEVQK